MNNKHLQNKNEILDHVFNPIWNDLKLIQIALDEYGSVNALSKYLGCSRSALRARIWRLKNGSK